MSDSDRGGDMFDNLPFEVEPVGPLGVPLPKFPISDGSNPPAEVETPTVESSLDDAVALGEGYADAVETAIENETCGFCKEFLLSLKDRPVEEQLQGVRELRELKQELNSGEMPDKEELDEIMSQFEVLELPGL